MLSTIITAAQTTPSLLNDFQIKEVSDTKNPLVNIHYQQNDYQALLDYICNGDDQGWILFLAPPGKPNTSFFEQAGIDKNRVLMIDSSKVNNNLDMLSTLLKSNNYCTVVTWLNELTEETRSTIETDAASTNTSCFIYCKQ